MTVVRTESGKTMAVTWDGLLWRRPLCLHVELTHHGPSLTTLIMLIARNRGLITNVLIERPLPDFNHEPRAVALMIRAGGRNHEERLLRELDGFGYSYRRE